MADWEGSYAVMECDYVLRQASDNVLTEPASGG